MNVADLIDAFGLPRNYAEKLPAGSSLVATVRADGTLKVEILPPVERVCPNILDPSVVLPVTEQKRGPGRPRKVEQG